MRAVRDQIGKQCFSFVKRFVASGHPRFPYLRILRSQGIAPHAHPESLSHAQVCKAYGLGLVSVPRTAKIGVLSLGGSFDIADAQMAFQKWGLPVPSITKISVAGGRERPDPGGADVENSLDVLIQSACWASMTGKPADIVFATAPNSGTGIADGLAALADAGCDVASLSWGAAESNWTAYDRAYTENKLSYCHDKGMWITVASGDNSLDDGTNTPTCDYPSGSAYVVSCGGTRLSIDANGARDNEAAWGDGRPGDEGGGGGFDPNTIKPSWQVSIPGNFRGSPDVCANADPNSGWQIVSNGQWMSVGGTSAAAPFWAALLAVVKVLMKSPPQHPAPLIYNSIMSLYDITTGSNGSPAVAGWDESSGLGSPTSSFIETMVGESTTQPPSPPPPTPKVLTLSLPQGLPAGTITVGNIRHGRLTISVPHAIPAKSTPYKLS